MFLCGSPRDLKIQGKGKNLYIWNYKHVVHFFVLFFLGTG